MKPELKYNPSNMKSLKILPKKDRKPFKDISSIREVSTRKALNAAEKEVVHLMDMANRRLKKVDAMVKESVASGVHLFEDVFIPEYLGFTTIDPEEGDIRIYSKSGFSITRMDNYNWLVREPNGGKCVLSIKNMYEAILILNSAGLELNINSYMNGEYSDEKTICEALGCAVKQIAINRESAKKLTENAR